MLSFFRESVKEFDHVVWPTKAETTRYFTIVLSVIVSLAVFLFIVGSVLSTSLFSLRSAIVPVKAPASQTSNGAQNVDLRSLLGSGASNTGKTPSVS